MLQGDVGIGMVTESSEEYREYAHRPATPAMVLIPH
jgi:hypothetical protein